jgi:formylglycine-generating enzyme required for sulfatase activity
VTRAQFQAFLADSGYELKGSCRAMWPGANDAATAQAWLAPQWPTGERQSDEHPMICINYHDVRAYIDWLNSRVGGRRIYMLPSEAQFEYAARAGTRGPWPWPGGAQDDACRYANVADAAYIEKSKAPAAFACDDGHAFTSRVGAFAANAFGVHDLIGNVWEWAQDCGADAHDLTASPRDGSPLVRAPADCSQRVTRGGGFVSPPWWSRVTARGGGHDPAVRVSAMGFRVAATTATTAPSP